MKRAIITIVIFSTLFFLGVGYELFYGVPRVIAENAKIDNWYKSNFNQSFSGVVTAYKEIRGNRGEHLAIVELKLRHSDIDYYDVRDSSNVYFCIIRYGTAKVMIPIQYELGRKRSSNPIHEGDSLVFDGQQDRFLLYYDSDTISWTPLSPSLILGSEKRMTDHLN